MEQEIACPGPSGTIILRSESIPFFDIPGQSKLFLEYQQNPTSLKKYYPSAVASHAEIAERIPEVLANHKADRRLLCDALEETNLKLGTGKKTFEHIEMLRLPDTVAVVSGQQAGFLTGPLYTVYKALSAVRAAECLRGRGYKAVPVFWAATEDHDFEEVSKTFVIDRSSNLAEHKTEPPHSHENFSVGYIKLDDSINESVRDLINSLTPTEFTGDLRRLLEEAWKPGEYFGDAFGKLLTPLLDDYGVIILSPLNEKFKQLSAPIYVEAIKKSDEIVNALRERSDELVADGYAAQVLIEKDYFPLFWQAQDNTRIALRKTEKGTVKSKDGSLEFTTAELAEIAAREPARFSPGVVLRSVVQDYILPTICYFGGGAEIAYFAQSGEVYRILERPATPILHRQSFTFVETKHAKTLKRYELKFTDLFAGCENLLPQIVEKYLNAGTAKTFAEAEEKINNELNRLDLELSSIDPTLAENLEKRRRKIIYHIGALRLKFYNAQMRKDHEIKQRLEAMFTTLLPRKHLQERALNITYFINKYGPNFIDWIYSAIDLDDRSHRVIYF